jgi:intracellular septation protein A
MHATPIARPRRTRPAWLRPGLIWFAFDLIVPTALFYLLVWFGTGLYLALLASAAVSAVTALVSYRRGAGGQRFAPYMLALALASFGIALVTGSDRFLLAKESVLTALVGFWFLGSLRAERPLAYLFTRPLLEGYWGRRWGLPDVSWEAVWEREPRFRRIWRVSTVMWGIATLADAILRVVIAYSVPVDAVVAAQTAMFLVTLVAMQPVTHVYYARAGLWRLLWNAAR